MRLHGVAERSLERIVARETIVSEYAPEESFT